MAKIPKFMSLEEAVEFWDTHDFEDYVTDTIPVSVTVNIRRRKKSLTIPLDLKVYQLIEALAAQHGVGIRTMVSAWLKEKALLESAKK